MRHDAVGVFDGRQAVRDDQRGAALHQPVQRLLHRALGFAVQRRGGLVEDQDRRVLVDRARDRQALALAARQLAAVVADERVQALRQRLRRSPAGWRRAAPRARARGPVASGGEPSATLAATLSLNSTTSWLTSANCRRSASTSQSRSGTPSSSTLPAAGLDEARQQVAPAWTCRRPTGPTSATVSPACTCRFTPVQRRRLVVAVAQRDVAQLDLAARRGRGRGCRRARAGCRRSAPRRAPAPPCRA